MTSVGGARAQRFAQQQQQQQQQQISVRKKYRDADQAE